MEILTPSVQYSQETDGRTQMLGVRSNGEQRLGRCPEEEAVDSPGILQCQASDLLRQSKHHMEILYRQQLGLPFGQPLSAGRSLTLRATPIAARVVGDGAMSALIALVHMAAQSGRSASADIVEGFSLGPGEYAPPAGQKIVSISAEDIGHFRPMFIHRSGWYVVAA